MNQPFAILVVDDQPIIRQVLVQALRRACPGALAVPVESLKAARAVAGQCAFNALITDYHLPDGTGLDVLSLILRLTPGIPSIVISADVGIGSRALASGATAFLAKPFTMHELLPLLRTLC